MTSYKTNIIQTTLLLVIIVTLALSCNSNKSFDTRAENSIEKYEASSIEIIRQCNNIREINGRDNSYNASITITDDDIIKNSKLDLKLTNKLCKDSLAQYIFLNGDSTICFNLKNSDGFNIFRHFIIFQPKDGQPDFDFMMTHSYKIIDKKMLKLNWTYIIIKQFFD